MKKILIALAILPLLIVACSSDDDVTTTTDFDHDIQLLYGEWRATGVEVAGVTIDLTKTNTELLVTPTYVTFGADGSYISEGILGEGVGTYGTKGKTIYTSVSNEKVNFEMTSLNATNAKIKLNAKALGLPNITGDAEMVSVVLTKDYPRTIDFDHDPKLLYGKWRATSVEGVYEEAIDLTNPVIAQLIKPTYVTFDKKGVYTSKGILGEGTGRYATKGKTIFTLVNKEELEFDMTALEVNSAKIVLNPQDVDFGIEIPKEVKLVTVVLTKQVDK